jgi:hypothetical protein
MIDHPPINRCSCIVRQVLAEPSKPTDIELGRTALVTELEEMRCDTVHLRAQRTAAKAPQHPRIFEIVFQHCTLSFVDVPGTAWSLGESDELLCGGDVHQDRRNAFWDVTAATYSRPSHM